MKRQITYGLLAGIAFWGLTSFSAYSATSDPPDSPCDDNNACTEEVFDGKDCQYRDLDGSVPCYTGPAGTRNVGQCKPGTLQCVKGIGMGTCQNEILPSKEQCNGIDNDCDGQTDEGFFAGDECTVMLNGCSQQGARICRADGSGADCQPLTNIKKNQCGICDGPPVSGLGNACSTLDFVSGCQQQGTFACNAAGDGIRCNPTTNIVKNACGVCGGPAIANANLLNTPCSDGEGNCSGSGTFQCNGAGNQILCSAQAMADGTICDDSYPCQNPATCQAGNCVAGSSKNTNDGNACTTDSCDPQTGIISHTPLAAIGQSCNTTMNDCPQTGLNICNLQYGAITCQVANPVSKNACGVCGIHTPQETCEEGVTALKPNEQCVDCQIVVTPPVGSNCSSNIFDCSRAIVIDLPITGTLNDFTILNPKNYDKEILVFAGANANNNANNRGGLFFAASKDIPTSGLKYCKTANDPLQHIKTANLRGYGEKDLIATTEKQYAVLADFETMAKDSLAQGCHLTPVLLSDPGESRGAPDLDLKLEKIHDIASVANENNLSSVIGALELKKEQGQGNKKFIGVDILSGIGNTFKKDFFVWQESPFQNSENILSLKIDAANGLADFRILATFSSQGVTRTESYGCSFSAEALSCTAPEKLPGRPLVIVDEKDVLKHVQNAAGAPVIENENGRIWLYDSGEFGRGGNVDADRHPIEKEEDKGRYTGFFPKEERWGHYAWFEPEGQNIIIPEETGCKAYRAVIENGAPIIQALEEEIYGIPSNDPDFVYNNPQLCGETNLDNHGGNDLIVIMDKVNSADGQIVGKIMEILPNINETPTNLLKPEPSKCGENTVIQVEAGDVMEDPLQCQLSYFRTKSGEDAMALVKEIDCKQIIIRTPCSSPDGSINATAKAAKSASGDEEIAAEYEGEHCAVDAGGAKNCKGFALSVNKSGNVSAGAPGVITPATLIEGEDGDRSGFASKLVGGGCGKCAIDPGQHFNPWDMAIFGWFLVYLSILLGMRLQKTKK